MLISLDSEGSDTGATIVLKSRKRRSFSIELDGLNWTK